MKKKVRSREFMSFQFFPTATLQGSNSVYSIPSFTIARSEFSTRKESDGWIASIPQEVPGTEGMLRSHKQGWLSHCRIIQRLFCCLIEIIKTKFVVCILKSFEFSPLQWTSPFSQNWKQGGISIYYLHAFYFPALKTVTKMDGGSGYTGFPFWSSPQALQQCFSGLCPGKASSGHPSNGCFQTSGKPMWETTFQTQEMRNCTWQLTSTPSRPVRFAVVLQTAKGRGSWKKSSSPPPHYLIKGKTSGILKQLFARSLHL